MAATGIRVELKSHKLNAQDGHPIRRLSVSLINDSNERISNYDGVLRVPAEILKHWSVTYANEEHTEDAAYREFRLSERNTGLVQPRSTKVLFWLDYCMKCAADAAGGIAVIVTSATVQAKVWIENREYEDNKTLSALRPADEP